MNLTFAAQLNKMITAGLGGSVEAPETGVAVGRGVEYTSIGPAPVLTFEANSELPLKALSINMEPIQEGSGDPSPENVRPISGRQSVTVVRTGRNVFRAVDGIYGQTPNVILSCSDGVYTYKNISQYPLGATAIMDAQFVENALGMERKLFPGTYTFSVEFTNIVGPSAVDPGIQLSMPNGTTVTYSNGATFTLTEPCFIYRLSARFTGGFPVGSEVSYRVRLDRNGISADFEPYTGQSVTVQLGQTVYGGTVDVVSGELVVDMAMVDLGTLNWSATPTSVSGKNRFIADIPDMKVGTNPNVFAICSEYAKIASTYDYGNTGFSTHGILARILIADAEKAEMNGTEFKAAMDGVQLCYELAQPITVTLTPEQLTTLLGTNNVWSDGGDVSATYGNIYYTEGY